MKNVLCELLDKIAFVTQQLKPDEFSEPLPVLMDNSIGKHVRHILDLVECLCVSIDSGEINYDNRKRDELLENLPENTLFKINQLKTKISNLNPNTKVQMTQRISDVEVELESQINREILYNIEHSVHHLAIIRIGIAHHFPHIIFPNNFGIAYSTVQYREEGKA